MASRVLKRGVSCQGEGQWLKYGFAKVNLPICALAFSDSEIMSLKNVDMLHAQFTGASIAQQIIEPKDIGQKRIGQID